MIRYEGTIVQFGFGAVGKSFYEKISREIRFNENKYYVITGEPSEFEAYINLGGMAANFLVIEVTRENFSQVFAPYLGEGDLLLDFADSVGTGNLCEWCARRNVMYLNTGEADWPDRWYSIFEENEKKRALKERYAVVPSMNRFPIVLQHGNNPGLVSHFVKAAIAYAAKTQRRKDRELWRMIREGRFPEAARALGVDMIHVNDIDLQEIRGDFRKDLLYSTWCPDTFWFEMLSEAAASIGPHEKIDFPGKCRLLDQEKGYLEFKKPAAAVKGRTCYPGGMFEGFLVPHEETDTIAKSLEIREGGKTVYRPTVLFLYQPCRYAGRYLRDAKVKEYPASDGDSLPEREPGSGETVARGYRYPAASEIVYQEKIASGTEYVAVLLLGRGLSPVWVGNRVEPSFLYRKKKDSYWQTPTITPVAMSALAAVCWMLKHTEKGGIYFPDDIAEYREIIRTAEAYISRTIFHTFSREEVEGQLCIDLKRLQLRDLLIS